MKQLRCYTVIIENYEFGYGMPPKFITLREIFPYFHRPTPFGFMLLNIETGERTVLKKKALKAKFKENPNLDYYLFDITIKTATNEAGESIFGIVVTVIEEPINRIGLINPLKEYKEFIKHNEENTDGTQI